MNKKNIHKERGSALLISVIITSSLLIVGVEVSMFVVSTIRQARSIDQTLVASYATESGLEDALHQIRKEGRTTLRADSITTPDNYYKDDTTKSVDIRNAWWTFNKKDPADPTKEILDPEKFSTTVTAITKSFLGEQEAVDIHLYTTDDSGFTAITGQIQNMVVSWKNQTCYDQTTGLVSTDNNLVPTIETTATTWPLTGHTTQWNGTTSSIQKNFQQPAPNVFTVTVPLTQLIPADQSLSTTGMTLRVKAFFCTLRNVNISFQSNDTPPVPVPIPNYVRIAPLGTYGSSQKTLQVIAPQKSGTSGIFDFTLFGDEVIDKKDQ